MATTLNGPALYSRDEMEALWARSHKMIYDCIEKGVAFPPDAPWHFKPFQDLVQKELHRVGRWQEDARKLAIVKEVFGGT